MSKSHSFFGNLNEIEKRKGNGNLKFIKGHVGNQQSMIIETFSNLYVKLEYTYNTNIRILQFRIDVGINDFMGDRVAWISTSNINNNFNITDNLIEFEIQKLPLAPGDYSCNIYSEINNEIADWLTEVLYFTIVEKDYYNSGKLIPKNQGSILLDYNIKSK